MVNRLKALNSTASEGVVIAALSHSSTAQNGPSSHNSLPNAPDQAAQPFHRAYPKIPPIHLYNTNTSKQALTLRLECPTSVKDRNQPALREPLSALKRPSSGPSPQTPRSRAARSQRPRGLPTRTKGDCQARRGCANAAPAAHPRPPGSRSAAAASPGSARARRRRAWRRLRRALAAEAPAGRELSGQGPRAAEITAAPPARSSPPFPAAPAAASAPKPHPPAHPGEGGPSPSGKAGRGAGGGGSAVRPRAGSLDWPECVAVSCAAACS